MAAADFAVWNDGSPAALARQAALLAAHPAISPDLSCQA
jgi:hypothetical protein